MRSVLLIVLVAMLPATGSAQSAADRDAVLKTVQTFFDTMTARDVEGQRRSWFLKRVSTPWRCASPTSNQCRSPPRRP